MHLTLQELACDRTSCCEMSSGARSGKDKPAVLAPQNRPSPPYVCIPNQPCRKSCAHVVASPGGCQEKKWVCGVAAGRGPKALALSCLGLPSHFSIEQLTQKCASRCSLLATSTSTWAALPCPKICGCDLPQKCGRERGAKEDSSRHNLS